MVRVVQKDMPPVGGEDAVASPVAVDDCRILAIDKEMFPLVLKGRMRIHRQPRCAGRRGTREAQLAHIEILTHPVRLGKSSPLARREILVDRESVCEKESRDWCLDQWKRHCGGKVAKVLDRSG